MKSIKSNWFFVPVPQALSNVRLFCFPYAGGGLSIYFSWSSLFSKTVELCLAQLPGRDGRFREVPLTDVCLLTNQIVEALGEFDDKPFAFFGHSLGAKIAFSVASELRKRGLKEPQVLFVSGSSAPHLPSREEPIYNLSSEQFVEALIEYGGMPEAILADKELLDLYIPILRADMMLNDTIKVDESSKLSCEIMAFGGLSDPWVMRNEIDAWCALTEGAFSIQMIEGDHFFINQKKDDIVRCISERITDTTSYQFGSFEQYRR